LSVGEECRNASTPLKSGIRIYRRLAASSNSSPPLVQSRDERKQSGRETNALTMATDDGRSDGLKTACTDARPEKGGGHVGRPADDNKHPVSTEHIGSRDIN